MRLARSAYFVRSSRPPPKLLLASPLLSALAFPRSLTGWIARSKHVRPNGHRQRALELHGVEPVDAEPLRRRRVVRSSC